MSSEHLTYPAEKLCCLSSPRAKLSLQGRRSHSSTTSQVILPSPQVRDERENEGAADPAYGPTQSFLLLHAHSTSWVSLAEGASRTLTLAHTSVLFNWDCFSRQKFYLLLPRNVFLTSRNLEPGWLPPTKGRLVCGAARAAVPWTRADRGAQRVRPPSHPASADKI